MDVRFVSFNNENNGAPSKDILQVPVGRIIRARTKSFKDALNGFLFIRLEWILICRNSGWVQNKIMKESFSICQF